jgi:hypothetical protein
MLRGRSREPKASMLRGRSREPKASILGRRQSVESEHTWGRSRESKASMLSRRRSRELKAIILRGWSRDGFIHFTLDFIQHLED